jgi:hypothetical protein
MCAGKKKDILDMDSPFKCNKQLSLVDLKSKNLKSLSYYQWESAQLALFKLLATHFIQTYTRIDITRDWSDPSY